MIKSKLQMVKKGILDPIAVCRYAHKKTRRTCCNLSVFYNSVRPIGTPVFTKDWDMLVILDTCRPDILTEVQSEYEFINNIDTIWSTGAMSAEWMATTFDRKWEKELRNCGYITANPHSGTVLENRLEKRFRNEGRNTMRLSKYGKYSYIHTNELGYYMPVWKQSDNDSEGHDLYGDPRKVTRNAIHIDRQMNLDKLILHYMPPHFPYVGDAIQTGREELYDFEQAPFDYIKETGNSEDVLQVYKNTLRWVLDEVEVLLNNVNRGRVILTADHGEAFGEYGTYKHPSGTLNPKVRRVPWVKTSAEDNKTLSPNVKKEEGNGVSVEKRLESLGYI